MIKINEQSEINILSRVQFSSVFCITLFHKIEIFVILVQVSGTNLGNSVGIGIAFPPWKMHDNTCVMKFTDQILIHEFKKLTKYVCKVHIVNPFHKRPKKVGHHFDIGFLEYKYFNKSHHHIITEQILADARAVITVMDSYQNRSQTQIILMLHNKMHHI